jgi:hypothetical protein
MMMKIQTVTFTQDNNSGTQTQLELKQPWALKDNAPMNVGKAPDVSIPDQLPSATKPNETIPPVD